MQSQNCWICPVCGKKVVEKGFYKVLPECGAEIRTCSDACHTEMARLCRNAKECDQPVCSLLSLKPVKQGKGTG